MANAFENDTTESGNLWSAADKGDTVQVKLLLDRGRDVNSRNCLGCTPLLYACGSGHLETVSLNDLLHFFEDYNLSVYLFRYLFVGFYC